MDAIQNYGIANYQIGFQARGGKNVVKTLADKMKQDKLNQRNEVRNMVTSLSEQYNCSPAVFMEAFKINGKITVNQLKSKISNFKKSMEELKQGLRQKLAKDNIFVENINTVITK